MCPVGKPVLKCAFIQANIFNHKQKLCEVKSMHLNIETLLLQKNQ